MVRCLRVGDWPIADVAQPVSGKGRLADNEPRSDGQGPSHGVAPVRTFSKIAVALADTSSYDHRSNAKRIDSRSFSLNSGLKCSP